MEQIKKTSEGDPANQREVQKNWEMTMMGRTRFIHSQDKKGFQILTYCMIEAPFFFHFSTGTIAPYQSQMLMALVVFPFFTIKSISV